DLLPLDVGEAWIEQINSRLPELPQARRNRYTRAFALPAYDATVLTSSRATGDYFERLVSKLPNEAKLCANWVMGELSARLNREDREIDASPIHADALADLLRRIVDGTISGKTAKEIFEAMWAGEGSADEIIERKGLKQISDLGAIGKIVDQVIAANAQQVIDYRAGKEKAFNSLVGQVMKESQGKANPAQVNEILKNKLG
ncbi:MAG: Asp-tRNA(Asn)/Glu-tRNA(Gln) amidotransferase GatCAB subunit B, partial [Prolixibacteraceae bacterium]|nr:Asp-tRNA(Asn)/Glu-tRNA(Gln) amidotransferase GatCAB subunit B [Burkholderiales bacterium]